MSLPAADADRYQRGCAGKDRHASEAAALAVAALQRTAMHAYRCRFCSWWHLATVPGATKRPTAKLPSFQRLRRRNGKFSPHPRRPVTFPEGTQPEASPVTCDGWTIYRSELEAIADARREGLAVGVRLRLFACTRCGGWHLDERRGRR